MTWVVARKNVSLGSGRLNVGVIVDGRPRFESDRMTLKFVKP
jgi:hypothetical protein